MGLTSRDINKLISFLFVAYFTTTTVDQSAAMNKLIDFMIQKTDVM